MTTSAPANPDTPVLSAEGLHTWFELRQWGFLRVGTVRAVDGVDFALARGESVAFVGESGCGKSSLARTLLGLHAPSHGRVVFEGRPLSGMSQRERQAHRARVGYIQQDPFAALPPFMDVGRILAEPLKIHGVTDRGERARRIEAALEEVRLRPAASYTGKFPHMLSGGQQQRVVIARALVLEPTLLVADEPVSMLDASVRIEILELLRRIRTERNLTLALITHDLSTVRHFAERVLVMYAGRIVESAQVDELLARPQHPYTQALLTALADPDPANAHRERPVPGGEAPSLASPPSGCRFHPRCPRVMSGLCEVEDPPNLEPQRDHTSACWLHR